MSEEAQGDFGKESLWESKKVRYGVVFVVAVILGVVIGSVIASGSLEGLASCRPGEPCPY